MNNLRPLLTSKANMIPLPLDIYFKIKRCCTVSENQVPSQKMSLFLTEMFVLATTGKP